jgi:hypothetical protein
LLEFSSIGAFIARHGPFGRIVIGDLTPGMRFATIGASPADVLVVDDGLAALVVAEERRNGAGLLHTMLDPPIVTFFSAYDVVGRPHDRVELNDYRCLRATAGNSVNETWVIGQPFIAHGLLDAADYDDILVQMRDDGLVGDVLYVAHPNEDDASAMRAAAVVGGRVVRFEQPVEFEGLARRPRRVVGTCSSALPQLAQLLGSDVSVTAHIVPTSSQRRNHDRFRVAYDGIRMACRTQRSLRMIESDQSRAGCG